MNTATGCHLSPTYFFTKKIQLEPNDFRGASIMLATRLGVNKIMQLAIYCISISGLSVLRSAAAVRGDGEIFKGLVLRFGPLEFEPLGLELLGVKFCDRWQ